MKVSKNLNYGIFEFIEKIINKGDEKI